MARRSMSPAAVARHSETFAAPVMLYIAMRTEPTRDTDEAEALLWQRALRFPHCAFHYDAICYLHEIGFARVRALRAVLEANLTRSSIRHQAGVQETLTSLTQAREEKGSLASMVLPGQAPDRLVWRAAAHADVTRSHRRCAGGHKWRGR